MSVANRAHEIFFKWSFVRNDDPSYIILFFNIDNQFVVCEWTQYKNIFYIMPLKNFKLSSHNFLEKNPISHHFGNDKRNK